MQTSAAQSIFKEFSVIRSLIKNERTEITLAERISDALKVILKQSTLLNENLGKVSKLGHEYEILKDLDHAGIPKVYGVLHQGSTVALVQEYIEGESLKTMLVSSKLSYSQILDIALQLSDILSYIHQKGVIHKDISSGNIMLTQTGEVKLIDFGISSILNTETNEILNVDQIEGTLTSISPEQTGRTAYSVTYSADFYSFGVLLYELFAGKPPFDSVDPLEVIHFHLSRKPIPLKSLVADLPDGMEQVIAKLMEKNPDDRYHSAIGLSADLSVILKHFTDQKPLLHFKAGLNDVTWQYKQSQKLYGRDQEISRLLDYFNSLNKYNSMLVLVAGYSGIGKSALIRHIKFPIIQQGGTFISGKFDQFKKDIPYYAFIEAIQEFIRNLLSGSANQIQAWKTRISSVLGENAGIITEVVPLLSRIIDQKAVVKLQPAEQETRFHMVMLDFIFAFSSNKSPLVVFLDDLQWADLPSLNLVKRILENPRNENILLIGAYRDNEVERGHPLLITLRQIHESSGMVHTVQLDPLSQETTCRITADSFGMDETQARQLGETVYSKTKGNPFFIHSFLKTLFNKKLVKKASDTSWIWDPKAIDMLGYTENVVDLMTDQLIDLPENTREVLKFAAVLGNTFTLADLADSTEKTQSIVFQDLKPAIQGGYVKSNDLIYRELALSSLSDFYEAAPYPKTQSAHFTFAHDKVQQAAYNLIEPTHLAPLHLRIGRLLLQNMNQTQLAEGVFELLNHFVISYQLIDEKQEKNTIAGLCLLAGRKAKDSTSYSMGVNYLTLARDLLGENSWDNEYELTYNVLFELGECEYLNNNPAQAEKYFKEILSHSKSNFDKLKVYYVHSSLYLKLGNTSESLRLGLEAFKLYHIHFPENKLVIKLATMLTMSKYLFLFSTRYSNPESLYHLKACKDEEIIALNKFLIDLATSAYQQDQNLMMLVIFRIIRLYIRYGFTDASGFGFSGFSVVVLSALQLQKKGFDLWDITLKLHQRTESPLIKWRLNYTVLTFHNHWRYAFRTGYDNILETIKACVLNGDHIFTGYAVALYLRTRLIAGDNLVEILSTSDDHLGLIKNEKGGLDFFQGFYQLAKALNGKTYENSWNDELFDGDETFNRLLHEGNRTKLAFFSLARCYTLYFFGQYKEAINQSQVLLQYSDNFLGDLSEVLQAFITSLSISVYYENFTPKEKQTFLKIFRKHLQHMKLWARGCTENFTQHYYLLRAEWNVIHNKHQEALTLYENAMQMARQNNIRYVEAIACERAAQLSLRVQLIKQSQLYAAEAWQAYYNWGATVKCQMLRNTYPELAGMINMQHAGNAAEYQSITASSSNTALDLSSVMKASQSIASQVKYNDLLKNLMQITIENAGAGRGCLLLLKDNVLCLEASGISGVDGIEIFPSIPLEKVEAIPASIVNYCWRTEEILVLNDAMHDDQFKSDPYLLAKNICAIMCIPITSLGKMKGLLYLENSLLKGVFNNSRIELLQMLIGQIGISIENSILYENLEAKVQERTLEIEKAYTELKATQSQLIQSEKMASLGELTAGIAHEIQNPLNFVNNFSEINAELIDELGEELEKGNLDEVKALAKDIKQNEQKINHHGKRADSIVKGMLQHSRSSSGLKELTDINALADEYLHLAYHGLRARDKSFNATLKTDFDATIEKIEIVPQDIGRVILNLITNAFYAVNEKKHLPGSAFEPTVSVITRKTNSKVELLVIDNGNGIPQKVLDKIFQPFFTTKPTGQGTGLGLSMSYDIVTKGHGGVLKVETKEGEGSTFTIILPVLI